MGLDTDRIFGDLDLSHERRLVVAVSGGSDSLALLLLLKRFLDRHRPGTQMLAVTVDHGLRLEAADEALSVAGLCRAHGIAHRTVAWTGAKPETGLMAAAREARHDLLAGAAAAFGADCILTGHTLDDQAETVAMRARRGSGAGLAGMGRSTLFDWRVWIVRPLLGLRREALREALAAQGVEWIDDPSNRDPAYERVRVRAQLVSSGAVVRLASEAAEAGRARRRLAEAAALALSRFASMPSPGLFRLDAVLLRELEPGAVHALRILLAIVGGAERLPDASRTQSLFDTLRRGPVRVALSRVVLDRRKDAVWLRREMRDLPDAAGMEAPFIWDGRWRVDALQGRSLKVAAFGEEVATGHDPAEAGVPKSLVRAALSAEPALFDESGLVAPLACAEARAAGAAASRIAAPFVRYLPDFDLPAAAAATGLLGIAPPPPSPWKHHNEPEA